MVFTKVGEMKTRSGKIVEIFDDDSQSEESDSECDCKEGECDCLDTESDLESECDSDENCKCNLNCAICDGALTDFEEDAYYYDKNNTWMCRICYSFTLDNE